MEIRITIALGVAALSLPGCVSWNIGERIRESHVTCTGVDVSRPVGGVVYESHSDVGGHYMQVPEVTYHERTPLVRLPLLENDDDVRAVDIKDTGKVCWVRRAAPGKKESARPAKVLETPPGDLSVSRVLGEPQPAPGAKDLGVSAVSYDAGYDKANLWSLPCRYVVDPLLTVASTAVAVPTIAVGGSVYGLWTLFSSPVKKAAYSLLPESSGDGTPMPVAPVIMP